MSKTINLGDLSKELKNFSKKHIEDLKAATVMGVVGSIPELVQSSPVDTGLYAQSWDFTVEETKVVLGNYAPHAGIIERGARPFTPPIQPLLAWAKRVLQDPSQPPDYSSEVWALARGTQAKIAIEGMKPRHVLEKALPGIIARVQMEIDRLG